MAMLCSLLLLEHGLFRLLIILRESHEVPLDLITVMTWLRGVAARKAKLARQDSGWPRTSQELTRSIAGGLSKGLELLGGRCGDSGLPPGGGPVPVDPTVSADGEDAP